MEKKVENDENDSKERFFTMFQEMMQYGEEISEEWLQLLADIDMMMSTNRERVGFDPSSYSFNYHSRHSLKALTEKMTRLMERMPPSSRSSDE